MFNFFKKLFAGQPEEDEADGSCVQVQTKPAPPLASRTRPVPPPLVQPSARETQPQSNGNGCGTRNAGKNGGAQMILLQLHSVVNGLPPELKGRVSRNNLGDTEISIPLEKVLAQLSLGSVKITFGELRRAAPSLFSAQNDKDQVLVALPLNEILAQLNPALLFRRQTQKHIVVPEEIRSPFGDTGHGLIFSVGPSEAPAVAPARAVTPAPSLQTSSVRKPAPMPARPLAMSPAPAAAALPTVPLRSSFNAAPTPAPSFAPVTQASALISMRPVQVAPAAVQPVQPVVAPARDVATVNLPLSLVSEGWPESLRVEIAQINLIGVTIAMPLDTLKESLQRGKAFFTWKTLRGWFNPAVPASVSPHDNTSLELPLRVVAPLFIARQRDLAQTKQKVAIDETIPNLFFGFPQPETAPAAGTPPPTASCAVTKPVDTNYYSQAENADAPAVVQTPVKRTGPTGTAFVTKCATPNEIVSRAAALGGVSGALIALPDGLMVASKLSADLNGDTLAAFLPQIFGKVNQCTKELRMGELNNLNFTVGNVPWKIFRVNAIFFAAFGRAGQPLPTAALAALAGELDHKKQ